MNLRTCSLRERDTLTLLKGVGAYYPLWVAIICLCCLSCFACNPFALPATAIHDLSQTTAEITTTTPQTPFFLPLLEGKLLPAPTDTPSPTNTPTSTPSFTYTPTITFTPTSTNTVTLTPTPTATRMPQLNVLFQTCDTGIDIFSGLGEVTNAYVTIQNIGNQDAENVLITLAANDEEKPHRDRQYIVPHLPPQYEISVKLTVDTKSGRDTVLTVHVSADNAASAAVTKEQCDSRFPDQERIKSLGILYKVLPIGGK